MSSVGSIQGFGLPQARNAPPASALGDLYNRLRAANLGGRRFVLNGFGEAWGFSVASGEQFTPTALAAWLQQPGHLWVDWCGWPGYYEAEMANGQVLTLGAAGWQTFAKALGAPWLGQVTFAVPLGYYQPLGVYPFSRGFPLQESPAGTAIQHGTFAGGQPLTANGYAALMALCPPSGSYYVYAAWTGGGAGSGVPAATVAQFITNLVAGRGAAAGIARTPWPAASGGTGGSSGSGGSTPAPGTSGPPWGEIALLGLGAAGVAAGAYYLVPGVSTTVGRWLHGGH